MSMCDGVTMYAAQHFCAAQGKTGPNEKSQVRFQFPERLHFTAVSKDTQR